MATVIDSFVIQIGLDPSQYEKGRKQVVDDFQKVRVEIVKTGKDVEDSSRKGAESIRKLGRELVALFALFTGARGLKDFVGDMVSANAELGRFSANLAQSPQTVAAWGMAAERMGGSAQATAASFEKVGKSLYDLYRNGQLLPKEFAQLQAAAGRFIRTDQGVDKFLQDTAAALKEVAKVDPARAHFLAQGIGIDDATANVMIKYGDAIGAYIEQLKKLSASDESIAAAQKLQDRWKDVTQSVESLANSITMKLEPVLTPLLTEMAEWVQHNKDWIATDVAVKVGEFAGFLKGIDWKAVGQGMHDFAEGAGKLADELGGAAKAAEVLFGLWAGGKAANLMFGGKIAGGFGAGAAGGGAAGAGGLGLLGLLGRLAPFASMLLLSGDTPKGAGEDPRMDQWTREWWHTKGWDRSGPSRRGRHAADDGGRAASLDAFLGTTVDGRPVSKSNPMPVALANQESSGGGFWSNLWNSVVGAFGMGAAAGPGSLGGSLISAGTGKGGDSSNDDKGGKATASVPNIEGMTPAERNKLGLILKYESRGRNVMNYAGRAQGLDPSTAKGYTAQGYYQILNSNWRRLAPKLGISARNAMAASLEDQTKVALALMRESGIGNWSNWNPSLRRALARGEQAGEWADRLPQSNGAQPFSAKGAAGTGMGVMTGARGAAQLSTIQNTHSATTSTSSNEMHIHKMDINAPGGDPETIANGISGAIRRAMDRAANATAANFSPG